MSVLMDLVAGDGREILLVVGLDDWEALEDRARFAAHLSLGGAMDPSWLDRFARAARETTGDGRLGAFTEACCPIDGPATTDRTIERVDRHWVQAVAAIPDRSLDRIAGRWIDLIDCPETPVDCDDKPMLRELVADLVLFCRRADEAADVLFAWSL